ncbi:hypothetical protein CWC20_20780 [Pseudoalteromonas aurantia]|uniref:Secreted protein n=1 Tax=Pseudoalteromonas aurantia TaxID=43654 RepID=A0ABY2VS16_9GAMM|nr:hypothetical protein CWC20_20780 [Pseudoalteromonas aurantia]
MPLAASFAKASSSFLFICICLSLTLNRVCDDKQLHKISYTLARPHFSAQHHEIQPVQTYHPRLF